MPETTPRPHRPPLNHTVHRSDPAADWVVLVHGAGVTSDIWDAQVEAYRGTFNLLLPDLRGHGNSPGLDTAWGPEPYSWESVSRDVLALMDHHGIETAHLMGVSMGTIVVRTVAELAPERVRSLVLPGAIARLDTLARVLVALAHLAKRFVPHLWLYRFNAWIVLPLWGHRESRRLVVRQAKRLSRREFLRWLRLTRGLPERLRAFESRDPGVPTLYVMGDQDHMFLPGALAAAGAQASAEIHVIEDCGHVCTFERAEEFNRVSMEFLRRS